MKKKRMMSLTVTGGETDVEDAERLRDANLQRVAEGMSRWCKPQSPHLDAIADVLEHAKTAGAEVAAWAAQLADVVRVLQQIDEAAQAGKGEK